MSGLLHKVKDFKLSNFLNNLIYLFRYSIKEQNSYESRLIIEELKYELTLVKYDLLYHKIVDYFNNNSMLEYKEEVDYIKKLGRVVVFPYEQTKTVNEVNGGFDQDRQMPYVIHGSSKRLYFPEHWSLDRAKSTYVNYVQVENLLGGNFQTKSPHQYQSPTIFVKDGDLVIDIGAAEALFSLDIVDKARRVIIIEPEKMWINPLKATFAPYKDKVRIINKSISTIDSEDTVTLTTCLMAEASEAIFIKMDIEGYETTVIGTNKDFFNKNINLSVACCTYHTVDDATILKNYFENYNFNTEFSEGYMLFYTDEAISPPFFRKGMIRASKQKRIG